MSPETTVKKFEPPMVEKVLTKVNSLKEIGGIALPPDIMEQWAAGKQPDVTVYYEASSPRKSGRPSQPWLKNWLIPKQDRPSNLSPPQKCWGRTCSGLK